MRDRDDAPQGRRFPMRRSSSRSATTTSIEDDQGEKVFKVDGKALRARSTYLIKDRGGNELAKVQEKKLSVRDKMKVERDGRTLATVHKALVGIRDRYDIEVEDGPGLEARGDFLQHRIRDQARRRRDRQRVQEVVPRAHDATASKSSPARTSR